MIENISFSLQGYDDYIYWQTEDKKTLRKINKLIQSARRTPFQGEGNPKPLRGDFSGYWSREIDEKNRLIYRVTNESQLEIVQCKGHYGDK